MGQDVSYVASYQTCAVRLEDRYETLRWSIIFYICPREKDFPDLGDARVDFQPFSYFCCKPPKQFYRFDLVSTLSY